jgi:hypothetical protein
MLRRQWLTVVAVLAMLLTIPGVALAASNGHGSGNGNSVDQFGPYHVATQDHGCGVFWADTTFDRYWQVKDNGDGTFVVTRQDKNGTFVTIAGDSPSANCEAEGQPTHGQHGTTLAGGIVGQMKGDFTFSLTSSTYDPTACESADCSTTDGFLAAVFQGGATDVAVNVCRFNFEYSSNDKSLAYHHWQDKSDSGPDCADVFTGDIATQ